MLQLSILTISNYVVDNMTVFNVVDNVTAFNSFKICVTAKGSRRFLLFHHIQCNYSPNDTCPHMYPGRAGVGGRDAVEGAPAGAHERETHTYT